MRNMREVSGETPVAMPTAANATAPLWDVRACARYLQKSPRWLRSALVRQPDEPGSIPHIRVGSSPRFIPEDIAAWVRQGCPPAATFAEWHGTKEKRKSRN